MIDALPLLLADDGYQISRSVRLRSSATAYFNRTPASAGSQTTWTWSSWVKRGALGVRQFITMSGANPNSSQVWQVEFDANNKLDFYNQTIGTYRRTTQVFRDVGAWYHIVFCADTNNATAQNRFRCWVNGVEITAWDVNSTISSGYTFAYNGAYLHGIGAYTYSGNGLPFDGYLTEINFIDGQALTPSSFGQINSVTGVWQPIKYTGTYGTNGFYLNFSDNSAATAAAIGKDYSGNGNNWTPNNISVTAGVTYDSMLDVPTPWGDGGNGRGNYAVMSPIDTSGGTLSNANLQVVTSATAGNATRASLAVSSGKWYWEVTPTAGTNSAIMIGVADAGVSIASANYTTANFWGYYGFNGNKYNLNTPTAYGASFAANDVIGVALDMDAGTVTFYKNNTSQGIAFSTLSGKTIAPAVDTGGTAQTASFNFGQRPFAYTPPSGFLALNTQNLPVPTILKGNQFFNATTYTGNGSTQSIVNAGGMQPDFVWIKDRTTALNHRLLDAVRGVTSLLYSNTTDAQVTIPNANDTFTSFNSNGFTLGVGQGMNANGDAYIAWQWKEGATQGFDIVTYTGNGVTANTIAHSLGVTPSMIIVKERNTAGTNWMVKHRSLATQHNLFLQGTNATTNITTAVAGGGLADLSSSSTFGFLAGTSNTDNVNRNGGNFVAYLFAEVAGFSRFGSYTGNGSTDGAFIYTGFRPRYVMVKASSAVEGWVVWDSERNTFNTMPNVLYPNLSNAEGANTQIDFLSNGFKLRNSATNGNISGVTYIYAAFAENPFKYSLAR